MGILDSTGSTFDSEVWAKRARVGVARLDDSRVRIEVADDGVGFDPARLKAREATAGGAFGLFGIREESLAIAGGIEAA